MTNKTSDVEFSTASPSLQLMPAQALVDEQVSIRCTGFEPSQRVTVRGQMRDDLDYAWESQATFLTDDQGTIDVRSQGSLTGTYEGVDPTGLFWSMGLDAQAPERAPFAKLGVTPTAMTFTAEVAGRPVASATLERLFVAPDVTMKPVREQGLVGTFFRPTRSGLHPGIIVMGGSGGGLMWSEQVAGALASHGYATLALAYFALEHLPSVLASIPLEYFETAIQWLQAQEAVRREEVAVVGMSRGGELVLLLGATFPQIKAVVSYVPSAVVWGGFGASGRVEASTWSYRDTPVPFLRNKATPAQEEKLFSQEPIPLTPWFLLSLEDRAAVEAAAIPVEKSKASLLLISAQDDQMWPCALMAERVVKRLVERRYPYPFKHLSYAEAGHYLWLPYLPTTVSQIRHPVNGVVYAFGGNAKDHAVAQADAWGHVLEFLEESLKE